MRSFEHVKRWLYVIVRNESIDYLRAKTRQKEGQHDLAYLETRIEEQAETERVRTILLQDIHKEIERLPKQRKTALRLRSNPEKVWGKMILLTSSFSMEDQYRQKKAKSNARRNKLVNRYLPK